MSDNTCKYVPVVAFAYNRADKIMNCLNSLEKNALVSETDIVIFCDGPKSEAGRAAVEATRQALRDYQGRSLFKHVEIIESPVNKGLAKSLIEGVTNVLDRYGRAIIVEDDLVVSVNFLSYMNGALDFYQDNPRIGAVSGYTYPLKILNSYDRDVYIMHKGDCWGWATWKDRWDNASWADVDFDAYFRDKAFRKKLEGTESGWDLLMLLQSRGKISSWAIRWVASLLKRGLCTVYPAKSLVTNAGFDGSGTHSSKSEEAQYFTALSNEIKEFRFEDLKPNAALEKEAAAFPRKGIAASCKYILKRCYVKMNDVKRTLK
jgi:glycosyltransferase involved in cell wall biosynthesis